MGNAESISSTVVGFELWVAREPCEQLELCHQAGLERVTMHHEVEYFGFGGLKV